MKKIDVLTWDHRNLKIEILDKAESETEMQRNGWKLLSYEKFPPEKIYKNVSGECLVLLNKVPAAVKIESGAGLSLFLDKVRLHLMKDGAIVPFSLLSKAELNSELESGRWNVSIKKPPRSVLKVYEDVSKRILKTDISAYYGEIFQSWDDFIAVDESLKNMQ
jgi:hypothetical protein